MDNLQVTRGNPRAIKQCEHTQDLCQCHRTKTERNNKMPSQQGVSYGTFETTSNHEQQTNQTHGLQAASNIHQTQHQQQQRRRTVINRSSLRAVHAELGQTYAHTTRAHDETQTRTQNTHTHSDTHEHTHTHTTSRPR